jgi:hypothetical protein
MTTLAIVALVATLAFGVAVGLLYLQRARRKTLVNLHLGFGLTGAALAIVLVATGAPRPGGPPGFVPVGLVAVAVAAGWFAPRISGIRRSGAERLLALHIVSGIAGFLALLAWIKRLA